MLAHFVVASFNPFNLAYQRLVEPRVSVGAMESDYKAELAT